MSIPRVDLDALTKCAKMIAHGHGPYGALIMAARDRIDVLEAALAAVMAEALPSGKSGPFMLTRDTFSKIAAVYSPGMETLRNISMKCDSNLPLTEEDVKDAVEALRRVGDQEQTQP